VGYLPGPGEGGLNQIEGVGRDTQMCNYSVSSNWTFFCKSVRFGKKWKFSFCGFTRNKCRLNRLVKEVLNLNLK
jgi:hypothetical protein